MDQFVRDFFQDHGYLALFVLMFLDNVGVPLPSEVPLLLGGYSVSTGAMDYGGAVGIAAAGSLLGALVAYVLGRTLGRAVVLRWGRVVRITHDDLDRAEAWFRRRGELTVLFGRMVPLLRTVISIPAGMLEMAPVRFIVYTLAGSALWCLAVIGAGWGLGANYERVLGSFSVASMTAAGVIAMVAVIWLWRRRSAKRRATPSEPT